MVLIVSLLNTSNWMVKPLHLWLMDIVNSTIDMEDVPSSFKLGSICSVYKGDGKDPLLPTNYRGITITSMFSKVLENLILSRLELTLMEEGFPHPNQSAFHRHTSCNDAIFASQDLIARYIMKAPLYICVFLIFRKHLTVLNSQCCSTGCSQLA